jgi:hypothetical protein
MRNYYNVQKRKLKIDDAKARSRAKEVQLKEKKLELIAMSKANAVELKERES